MAITLSDDGTLDTVLRCDECGEEFRFNWDGCEPDEDRITQIMEGTSAYSRALAEEADANEQYQSWVEDCIAEVESEHECHTGDDEPQEGDITTEDHRTFYQDGRLVLEASNPRDFTSSVVQWYGYERKGNVRVAFNIRTKPDDCVAAINAYMDRVQYWPNAWWISDHGNAHRMDLTGK